MADETNQKKKHFFKDMKTELKKVTWLTPKQLVNNTTAVIVMVVIVAALVFVLDFTFENINKYGVEGLKTVVQKDTTNTVEDTTQNDAEQTDGEDATAENEEQAEGTEVTENSSSEEQE